MKQLNITQMEQVSGGKLTKQEIKDFLGAASCASILLGGAGAIWGALGCADWLFN